MLENLLKEFGITSYARANGYTIFHVSAEIVSEFYQRTRTQDFILHYSVECSAINNKTWIFGVKEL